MNLFFRLFFTCISATHVLKYTVWNTNFKLASALLASTDRKTEISPSLQVCTRILFDSWLKTARYHIKLYSIVDEPTLQLLILINFVSRQVRPGQKKKKIVVLTSSGISEYLGRSVIFFLIIFFVKSTQSTKVGCFLQKRHLKKNTQSTKVGCIFHLFPQKRWKKHPIWQKLGTIQTLISCNFIFGDGSVAEGNTTFFFWPDS